MKTQIEIFRLGEYKVHRKFRCRIPKLANYLVKTLGLDFDEKKRRMRRDTDSLYRKENHVFLERLEKWRKRRYAGLRRGRKNKNRYHEFAERV